MTAAPNRAEIEIVPLSLLNARETFRVAKGIFPRDSIGVGLGYFASLLPKKLLPGFSKAMTSVELGQLDYFVARQKGSGKIVGITGLYAVRGKSEAWVGWYGVSAEARGQGYGNSLLDWTINTAKERGFDTLRLWTSTDDTYKRANEMYVKSGFEKQEAGVANAKNPESRILLYSLGLKGNKPKPFEGNLQEALLGATPKEIERGRQAYQKRYMRPGM